MSWENEHREDGLWTLVVETQNAIKDHVRDEELDPNDSRLQQLNSALSHLSGYQGFPDVLITSTARSNVGRALEAISSQLPAIDGIFKPAAGQSVSKFEAFVRAFRSWPQRGSVSIAGLKQHVEQLETYLGSIQETASQQLDQLKEDSSVATEEVDANKQERLNVFGSEVDELRSKLETLHTEMNTASETVTQAQSEIEESRQQQSIAFKQEQEERSEKFSKLVEKERGAWENALETSESQSQKSLEDIERMKDEAEALLGAMAQRSTATDYSQWAEQQRKSAKWWSWTAVTLFILAAGVFVESTFHFFTSPQATTGDENLWGDLLSKLGMTGVVLAGAFYAAREAGQHRKEERNAKARELVLTTMDPFMANINQDVRELIRTEAAQSIFVLPNEKESRSEKNSTLDRVQEIIRSRSTSGAENSE